ncbi:MAG: class I SAM-dependent RNA methyltransferase [Oscillospiraceae bacterium]|nr:class I SAM-dependent RNA methyltransferase [Oscillospiraceae bacterium]
MSTVTITCPCLFGLESVLSGEIKRMGGENIRTVDGRVTFTGDMSMVARANICLRTAERVQILLGSFEARSFEELFQGVKAIPFEEYVGKNDAFPVKGWSLNSQLHSIPDCQSIIKKAIVTRLQKVYGVSWFQESGTTYQVQFSILKDNVLIMLDTSGMGLHKRGYRRSASLEAPIKETLAAGIIDIARVYPDSAMYDPFCGSGTFVIEAAMHALKIAPGLRRHFAAEQWACMPKEMWQQERQNAFDNIRRDATFMAYASDISDEAVELTMANAKKAGVDVRIKAVQRDVADFAIETEKGVIITNPPYGERLLDVQQAEQLYRILGKVVDLNGQNRCYVITPHEEFERIFGKKADKKRKLYNGMLKCNLYQYFK